jgi:hypothetical protein
VCGTTGNAFVVNDSSTAQPTVETGIVVELEPATAAAAPEKKPLAPTELELLRKDYLLSVTLQHSNRYDIVRCNCFLHECHHQVWHTTAHHELPDRFSIDSVQENGEYRDAYFESEFGKAYSTDKQIATVTFMQLHRKPHFKTDMLALLSK